MDLPTHLLAENQSIQSQLRETQAALDSAREDHWSEQCAHSETRKKLDKLIALVEEHIGSVTEDLEEASDG